MYKKGKGRKGVKARQQQDNGQYQEMLTPRNDMEQVDEEEGQNEDGQQEHQ
jgi:hypothetical protein